MRSLATVAVVALLALGACGSDPGSDAASPQSGPADAVEQLLRSLEAGSCPEVKAIVVTPATVDCDQVETLAGSFEDEGVDLDDVSYAAGRVEGDSVVVTIDWGTGEPEEAWDVERVGDSWKVIFDSVE
ncbi:MAG: hypothetical protein ABWX74_09200 [Aeromicrobium sp.]